MMKRVFLIAILLALSLVGCKDKANEPGKGVEPVNEVEENKDPVENKDKKTSLDPFADLELSIVGKNGAAKLDYKLSKDFPVKVNYTFSKEENLKNGDLIDIKAEIEDEQDEFYLEPDRKRFLVGNLVEELNKDKGKGHLKQKLIPVPTDPTKPSEKKSE